MRLIALCLLAGLTAPAMGVEWELTATKLATGTYVVVGRTEDFSRDNQGQISNSGFIVTDAGVVVIDTGSSLGYGLALRKLIATHTQQPVLMVINTHDHPDHWFGNQAFAEIQATALPASIAAMRAEQEAYGNNLYRMVGEAMQGTEPQPATAPTETRRITLGGHDLQFIALKGHSDGDLALLDHTTGVLFAGDLVFWQRAPTTPHAKLPAWLAALNELQQLPWKILVPGHGEPHTDQRGIEQTRRYLNWLDASFKSAAEQGTSMAEVLATPLPAWVSAIPLADKEYSRSVAHLYRELETMAIHGQEEARAP